jgi:hypothetical protein
MEAIMKIRFVRAMALGCLLTLASIAAANEPPHTTVMRGQLLEIDGAAVVLCIGTRDGASVGQLLDVVRHVRASRAPKAAGAGFRREQVGQIRVVEVFDEHYSRAEVVSGRPRVNDSAELLPTG